MRNLYSLAAVALTCGCAQDVRVASASVIDRAAPAAGVSVPPSVLNRVGLAQRVLAVHNRYRARVGVLPLRWDPALATAAQNYARELARTGRFAHSERSTRVGQGENLWTGTADRFALETMLGHWGEERNQFRPGIFPNISRTAKWADVAHYTQMVWRTTSHVGCAIQSGRGSDYLVCRYSPAGNRNGDAVP